MLGRIYSHWKAVEKRERVNKNTVQCRNLIVELYDL